MVVPWAAAQRNEEVTEPRSDLLRKPAGSRPLGVAENDVASHVRSMFSAVAPRYDRANHLLSAATDIYWRHQAARRIARELPARAKALDICCGTGDMSFALARRLRAGQTLWAADFSHAMLLEAQRKAARRKQAGPLGWIEADALQLPWRDDSLDAVLTGYGFRNLAGYEAGLREFHRVLKPGGRLYILEFFRPELPVLKPLYEWYFSHILPRLGHWLTGRRAAYEYLPRSVAHFATVRELAAWMRQAGFADVGFRRLTGGITALHWGVKQ